MKYAIVDIETTGGYADANGITEISIQVFDGQTVVNRFDTLVNPRQRIPPFITVLTGITDEMVQGAPVFEKIAPTVYDLLRDKIFVAHNVNFDYSFVKSQLRYCGFELDVPRLCTVRLARMLLPGCPSYSLEKLCHFLNIKHVNKHRAGGDTDATVELFKLLTDKDTEGQIAKSLKRTSKEQALPPNLPKADFDALPYTPGVYYFHDEKGKVVYVGKAKNIRQRVSSHFSNNGTGRQKQHFLRYVYHISYEECGTELVAAIKESTEIRRLWPKFNAAQKRFEPAFGIICYEDQNGYLRLAVERQKNGVELLAGFYQLENAKAALRELVAGHGLCPKLCFIAPGLIDEAEHQATCKGACQKTEPAGAYNDRVLQALSCLKGQASFAIIDKGASPEERSCIVVWKGKFFGMGFIDAELQLSQPEAFKDAVTPYKDNITITNLLHSYAKRYPAKVLMF